MFHQDEHFETRLSVPPPSPPQKHPCTQRSLSAKRAKVSTSSSVVRRTAQSKGTVLAKIK